MSTDIPLFGALLHQPTSAGKIRVALFGFGLFLGLCGLWLLVPALVQPKPIGFAQNRNSANMASIYRDSALQAAEIGVIRGDLWAQAAFTDSILMWQNRQLPLDKALAERVAQARANMEKALAFAPIDGEGWLFLTLLPAASAAAESRITAWLEMSYFTAPQALDIAPLRIERAATSTALSDKTIQEFVKSDIRLVLTYRPQLKPAILTAYRNAGPQNQPIFEGMVMDIDPAVGQMLRSGQAK